VAGGTDDVRLLRVDEANRGTRLDAFVAQALGIGRRAAVRVAAAARVNGRRASKGRALLPGDEVRIGSADAAASHPEIAPTILHVDADLIVLDKPAGLPTVALVGRTGPSVAQWLRSHRPECAGLGRPGEAGLVHRLDTPTSGLLLAARSESAYAALRSQFRGHAIEKAYLALVTGALTSRLRIDASIGQHRKSRTRVRALPPGPHPRYSVTVAETDVTPVRALGSHTLVEARTRTGARHQVRAHLAHAGHPLVADTRYGGARVEGVPAYLLHACEVSWRDPVGGEPRTARSEAPRGWDGVASRLAGTAIVPHHR